MKGLEPLIFEISKPGRKAYSLPELDVPVKSVDSLLPEQHLRERPAELPEVSEVDVVRHFTRLSQLNFGVDIGFYPLGSCTMKYNPKINEEAASLPGFNDIHPYVPEDLAQGCLELMYDLQNYLAEIAGMEHVSLQPAAGAHGELTGILIIRAYHRSRNDHKRTKILVPDSAHGTNPASAALGGFTVVEIPSDERGGVSIEHLDKAMDDTVAGLMLTNPNTLGLFDENIEKIEEIVHSRGGLLYYDGANANAILGISRPGDMGFDVLHFNLHKTFSTPHGGGGPGSGPVAVKEFLEPFLPVPTVTFDGQKYNLYYDRPQSIGRMKSFYGNFLVMVKAYAYIRALGPDGLRRASEDAVLNANYIMRKILEYYDLPYDRHCKHEFVVSPSRIKKETGVRTLDISKRLLDYGFHPPTNYFPLIVDEALMIEPTETESKETLDAFCEALIAIAKEAYENSEVVKSAPHTTVVGRLDEAAAARNPNVRWRKPE
ncbi:MAG TPA: aminomethyl-transferring glycine dehydrogenase subunit GcvPB [Bacillota bacterium]|nr:aminomethyl-transferring glycine dehydrogenase subunit GcvPB [Candidatus Fermentithermobacillaceae bacterium]HOB30611.1 aminomethyl-transferring glycine dehydrogenase subunit GcvPB [Bacillota bacterium]HOK64477.1 aminomethyl-transferring glycine dehydrogenase subunit GcvPB [Bacillota bacterium]HOL11763.1 aminomethyl-transferring glycine dehydrogenase subunit GcvPB [Bacillota bacterium]HOQ02323.1 aminomethyl-transferring glycine dehydrogenase subunit GcvPB [Bacillota bacterium]